MLGLWLCLELLTIELGLGLGFELRLGLGLGFAVVKPHHLVIAKQKAGKKHRNWNKTYCDQHVTSSFRVSGLPFQTIRKLK